MKLFIQYNKFVRTSLFKPIRLRNHLKSKRSMLHARKIGCVWRTAERGKRTNTVTTFCTVHVHAILDTQFMEVLALRICTTISIFRHDIGVLAMDSYTQKILSHTEDSVLRTVDDTTSTTSFPCNPFQTHFFVSW